MALVGWVQRREASGAMMPIGRISHAIFKILLLGLFGAILFWDVETAYTILNEGGYCFAKQRFLSKDEVFDRIIKDVYSGKTILIATRTGFRSYSIIGYSNAVEFLAANPKAVEIIQGGDELAEYGLPFGYRISVGYTARYLDDMGRQQATYISYFRDLDNCGEYEEGKMGQAGGWPGVIQSK